MADLDPPVRRVDDLVERRVDGEAVVVRADLDPAGGAVLHRLVDAAVPELQLVGAEAERAAEHLVAEADAEQRHAARPAPARTRLDGVVGGRRVARAVGDEDPVGADARAARRRSTCAGSTCTSMPRSASRRGVIALMPRSSAATGEAPLAHRRHDVRLRRSSPRRPGRRPAIGGRRQHPLEQRRRVGLGRRDSPTRIAPRSRRCRVSARVSMPLMPTTPCATSSSSRRAPRPASDDATGDGSRTT